MEGDYKHFCCCDVTAVTKSRFAIEMPGDALARIGQLLDIECAAMGRAPQQRARIRRSSARRVIDDLAAFLQERAREARPRLDSWLMNPTTATRGPRVPTKKAGAAVASIFRHVRSSDK
jgi:hypothetical protein